MALFVEAGIGPAEQKVNPQRSSMCPGKRRRRAERGRTMDVTAAREVYSAAVSAELSRTGLERSRDKKAAKDVA
jgi:hypothetical protein